MLIKNAPICRSFLWPELQFETFEGMFILFKIETKWFCKCFWEHFAFKEWMLQTFHRSWTFLECFELKFWSHKMSTKMGVQDHSLKMARNALEETNEWKMFTCSKNERSTVVPSKVRGKLKWGKCKITARFSNRISYYYQHKKLS